MNYDDLFLYMVPYFCKILFLIHVQEINKCLWNNLLIISSLISQRNAKKSTVQSGY